VRVSLSLLRFVSCERVFTISPFRVIAPRSLRSVFLFDLTSRRLRLCRYECCCTLLSASYSLHQITNLIAIETWVRQVLAPLCVEQEQPPFLDLEVAHRYLPRVYPSRLPD